MPFPTRKILKIEEVEPAYIEYTTTSINIKNLEKKYKSKFYILENYFREYNLIKNEEEYRNIKKTKHKSPEAIKILSEKAKKRPSPFKGKKLSPEKCKAISERLKGKFTGSKNPFFGKRHSQEVLDKIKETQRKYVKTKEFKEKCFNRHNISIESLKQIFEEYMCTNTSQKFIAQKYNLDWRTLQNYFKYFNLIKNEEEYKIFKKKKQKSISTPELTIYVNLCAMFGEKNIIRQFQISKYFYDFLVYDKFLIEFDGRYWHSLEIAKTRDQIKNILAKHNSFNLFRIKENDNPFDYNYSKILFEIKEKIDEIQTKRN